MRLALLILLTAAATLFLGCSKPVSGPSFKHQLSQGQSFFGEAFSPVTFTNAGPLKVAHADGTGFFLVTGIDGQLYAFELATGKARGKKAWTKLPKGVRATPVYDPVNKQLLLGCYDRQVYALDVIDGATHWAVPVDGYVQAPVALSHNTIVVGTMNGTTYGISPLDGSIKWQVPLGGEIVGRAGVHESWPYRALVTTTRGKLVVLDTRDGAVVTEWENGELHTGAAVVALQGKAVAYVADDAGELYAWELPPATATSGTATQLWSADLGGSPSWATPAVASNAAGDMTLEAMTVYTVTNDSMIRAFNAATGELRWETELLPHEKLFATPLVTETHVYVPSMNHKLYALDRDTGEIDWEFESYGVFRSTPLLDENRIIAVSNDHFLYALDWETGKPLIDGLQPEPAPMQLDATRGMFGDAERREPLDDSKWKALQKTEVRPVIEAIMSAIIAADEAGLKPYMNDDDGVKQAVYAAAVREAFAPYVLQTFAIGDVVGVTPSNAFIVVSLNGSEGSTPVRMVLTVHLMKDASREQAWRVEPESLRPENVVQVPQLEELE